MQVLSREFNNLEEAVEFVHELFLHWQKEDGTAPKELPPFKKDPSLAYRTKLAFHEWLSNLAQHASFANASPKVSLSIEYLESELKGTIRDNSVGFDLDSYTAEDPSIFSAFPERGMGLQIIKVCVDDFSYEQTSEGDFQFTFTISNKENPPSIIS